MKYLFTRTLIIIEIILVLSYQLTAQGFLHRLDKKIVDENGNEILLKGIGLGGWLVQEGYMLQTSSFANAQWQIRQKITELIGETNTSLFYEKYRKNFIRKIDIDSIKSWEFNSIRLPMHYNLFATNTNPPNFLNTGFDLIDSLLSWCEQNQIYLILDMHAAPGGQSDEGISDYNPAYPSLWESETNKDLLVKIWRKIAERYKDKIWIGGYDLINEPKWDLGPNNQPLRDLYIRLKDTIRAVDSNHILFIEGNWYATDFSGLTPAWDDNMAYSFHKYWNTNNQPSIQYLIDLRNNTNRPLWLGETGENSNAWFVDCIELMKNNGIGWAWWTLKKVQTISAPLSAYITGEFQVLLNYWNGQGAKPTATFAFNALMNQADQLLLENCVYHKDYIDALMRQPFNSSIIPYSDNQVPGTIYASNYDLGKINSSYNDVDYQNTGNNGIYNQGYSYRNDGVDIEPTLDLFSNGYNVGWIETGEWLKFTLNVKQSGIYNLNLSIAAQNSGGKILVSLDGLPISTALDVPVTGGWQNWQTISLKNVYISTGKHTLQTQFFFGGFNFSYINFDLVTTDVKSENHSPVNFELKQNYPNPFNPTTTIKYSIPQNPDNKLVNVSIKIFDVLGNEITEIVNEEKSSGDYEVSFDAKSLPSGIYFYELQAGNNLSAKKMLILK
jgi:hypothetical protein